MGSESDLPVMEEAARVLEENGIPHEVRICSAHRTPEQAAAYARKAAGRGLKVLIAGAGGAAHLAGALAAGTVLPVIGVPLDSSPLQGLDALLATVQMPAGVPVATVAIGKAGARNAALLALAILATADPALRGRLEAARQVLAEKVQAADKALQEKRRR
ncbi:MAG: 5-(carboxyamino)imidazole ribonucleotide mutase [candidate division NC10 bacterium]|nr:5-(carboxyamino)imidazole ribonucleotide mutase [candidate division NC10 bacterium]